MCTLLTVACKVCVVQVSPRSANKLKDCLTLSELEELSEYVNIDSFPDFPIDEDDKAVEKKRYPGYRDHA